MPNINKDGVSEELARRLSDLKISSLVSIVTLRKAVILEPGAPSPKERFEAIRNLAGQGLKPMIFLRPIIPTLTECEAHEIMVAAKNHGAEGIVLGSLRVSSPIEERLKKASIDIEPPLISEESQVSGEKLVNISMHEVKKHLGIEAEELGLVPFYSACCANAYNAGIPCQSLCWNTKFCTDCPNNCLEKIPQSLRIQ